MHSYKENTKEPRAFTNRKQKAQRILITGCNGFVGTSLVHTFCNDFKLFGLDLPGAPGLLPDDDMFSWDAIDRLPAADAIIHLAGKAHDTANTTEENEYFEVNLGLTKTIFDHFLQSGAGTFIFFSTVKAVADTVRGDMLTEDAVPDPQTPYGRSKLAAEQYIEEEFALWANKQGLDAGKRGADAGKPDTDAGKHDVGAAIQGFGSGKKVYILRPCMIHGPGNKGNLNLLYGLVKKGLPWPLGAFSNRRSFLSAGNLLFVLRRLAEGGVAPGTYQLADDEALSTNELIALMAHTMNRKARIWKLPAGLVGKLAAAGDKLRLPLNGERLKKLTESYVVSNARIKHALGISKMPISATDGLIHTLQHFKNQ